MGIAILVIMGAVAAFGVFAYLALSRGSRQHVRGAGGHHADQYGALWGSDSGGWSAGHSTGHGGWGGFDGGGSSCGGDGGGGGSC